MAKLPRMKRGVQVTDLNPPGIFSDSDIESLEFAKNRFGHLDQFQLAEVSHAYQEWKRFEKKLESGIGSVFNMNYEDFFKDAMPGSEYLAPLEGKDLFVMDVDDKEEVLNYVKEQMELKNQWEQIPD
ncbi:MAG: SocA family protein [Candidatus Kuenenia sp.]|nr:SocA family protein [Candidatus Kuenenia hertensis]